MNDLSLSKLAKNLHAVLMKDEMFRSSPATPLGRTGRPGLLGHIISFYIVPFDPTHPAKAGWATLRSKNVFDSTKRIAWVNLLKVHFLLLKLITVKEISSWMMKAFH